MKYKDGNTWKEITIKALDSMSIGSIILFAGSTIPAGWLKCEGQSLLRTEYSDLFGVINTIYGNVDSTHFNLPNYKGRVPVGLNSSDTDFDTLGETGGSKELQEHSHIMDITTYTQPGGLGYGDRVYNVSANDVVDKTYTSTTRNAGTGDSGNLQPYIVVNYIIKAKNTTPTMASIVDDYSTSTQDGYSANYVNEQLVPILDYVNGNRLTVDNRIINDIEVPNAGSVTGTINSVSGYDFLLVVVRSDWNHIKTIIMPYALKGYNYDCYLYENSQYYLSGYLRFSDDTHIVATKVSGAFGMAVIGVYGIKIQ